MYFVFGKGKVHLAGAVVIELAAVAVAEPHSTMNLTENELMNGICDGVTTVREFRGGE